MEYNNSHRKTFSFGIQDPFTAAPELQPTINYVGSRKLQKIFNQCSRLFNKLWLFCSYELTPEELPTEVLKQLKGACLHEGRKVDNVKLIRKHVNVFEIRENDVRTYWCLYIDRLIID